TGARTGAGVGGRTRDQTCAIVAVPPLSLQTRLVGLQLDNAYHAQAPQRLGRQPARLIERGEISEHAAALPGHPLGQQFAIDGPFNYTRAVASYRGIQPWPNLADERCSVARQRCRTTPDILEFMTIQMRITAPEGISQH